MADIQSVAAEIRQGDKEDRQAGTQIETTG